MPVDAYQRLLTSLALETTRLEQLLGSTISMHCRPGCSSCCQRFSVLAIEAACLARAISTLSPETRERILRQAEEEQEHCPCLLDGLCAIYQARPIICRTHGLALAHINEELEAIEVSACPINFGDDFAFGQEQLLFMDPNNEELRTVNLAYCRLRGLQPDQRIPIREIAMQGCAFPG